MRSILTIMYFRNNLKTTYTCLIAHQFKLSTSNLIRPVLFFLLLLICHARCLGQGHPLKPVPGLPSTEIYDLYTDSKGFLWIAHDAGISKYDGISFTNFSNPQQSSLGTTNIVEDKHGRIWFINFTGQIFYIENGHMNLLKAYKSESESYFPRIGLLNDLLVATSEKGLFICNTNTLACHYERCADCGKGPQIISVILSVLKDKVLTFGGRNCYVYQPGKGLRRAVFNDSARELIQTGSAALCTRSFNDTAFLFINPSNILYKLTVENDTVKIVGKKQFDSFINTVSIIGNNYWINTIKSSTSEIKSKDLINGYDVSCITTDKEGHHWYGSLERGLLTDSATAGSAENAPIFHTKNGDHIKCLIRDGQSLLLGTQNGLLLAYNTATNRSILLTALPAKHGGISYLKLLKDGRVLIGSPLYTYIFDVGNRLLKIIDPIRSIKQADEMQGALIAASSSNMIMLPDKNDEVTFNALKKNFKGLTDFDYDLFGDKIRILQHHVRCLAICYSSANKTIWASFKNGLYRINASGTNPFYYHRLQVYASCLTAYKDKVFVGTFSDGILIADGDNVRQLSANDGLLSNYISNLKVIDSNLWVYTSKAVQIFDIQSLKLIYKYPFPGSNNISLNNAEEINGNCYFTSSDGLYKLSTVQKEASAIDIYLNSLSVNRKDTGVVNNLVFSSTQNDIQVSLGTPYLFNAHDIVIKYSLATGDNARWIYGRPGERNFHFASLAPASYRFEALAIKPQTGISSNLFVINFQIRPPWWQTWWFRLAIIFALIAMIVTAIRVYYLNKLKKQQIEYEKKLIVERERQHISREIHDNIGQALSVIKLNLDMTSPAEVEDVKDLIGEVIQDLRQFTHGLYYGKLLTEGLIDVIKKDVERINNSKQLTASLNINITKKLGNEQSELLIYRMFQEAINNVLKHAQAKNVIIEIQSNKRTFKLSISDDGQGFSPENAGKGLGFDSMYKRAELLNGQLTITGRPGLGSKVELVIDHKQSIS